MENTTPAEEQRRLETVLTETLQGKAGYDTLMDALGRAVGEHIEVYAVRSAREKLQQDGTPIVEFLTVPAGKLQVWLCLTGPDHLRALTDGKGPVRTAVLTLGTLLSMAADAEIDGIVLNPDTRPNLTIGRNELQEIQRRAAHYLETCRREKLQQAGTKHRPGWII